MHTWVCLGCKKNWKKKLSKYIEKNEKVCGNSIYTVFWMILFASKKGLYRQRLPTVWRLTNKIRKNVIFNEFSCLAGTILILNLHPSHSAGHWLTSISDIVTADSLILGLFLNLFLKLYLFFQYEGIYSISGWRNLFLKDEGIFSFSPFLNQQMTVNV